MVCRELPPRIYAFLKRAANLAFLALLMTSLAAPGVVSPCCQRPTKKAAASDHCSHHMAAMQACRAWRAGSSNADCSCISDATEPTSSPVPSSEGSSDLAATNGNATADLTVVTMRPRPLPEKPPPLQALCSQALRCTFLI